MSEWQPIETAPKDGTEFLAKQDGEIYHAKFQADGRFVFRTHTLWEPREHRLIKVKVEVDGEGVDAQVLPNEGPVEFLHSWTYWTRGGNFWPTHWMPMPETLENEGESQ